MRSVIVDLSITADEYLKRYQQLAAVVFTHGRDGRSIRFPANILQPYVTHSGIQGSFQIQFDRDGKFSGIEKV
ncbi:MAG: DUF2835 domain-containing protein [Pseudomonadales bacterium]